MTEAGRMDLIRRMGRVGCAMYASELGKTVEVDDALALLQARGLVVPATWKLTDLGRETAAC
jgi:hypothetical protein